MRDFPKLVSTHPHHASHNDELTGQQGRNWTSTVKLSAVSLLFSIIWSGTAAHTIASVAWLRCCSRTRNAESSQFHSLDDYLGCISTVFGVPGSLFFAGCFPCQCACIFNSDYLFVWRFFLFRWSLALRKWPAEIHTVVLIRQTALLCLILGINAI
jgi:hypothetical protein